MRPITIHERPIFVPYVCIQCGLGGAPRTWFVDLGFAIDHYFNTGNNAIYLCNECYNNLTVSVGRVLQQFMKEREAWRGEEQPSYNWVEQHDVREPESIGSDSGSEKSTEIPTGVDSSSDTDDSNTEHDDSESEQPDSSDASTIADSGELTITFGNK